MTKLNKRKRRRACPPFPLREMLRRYGKSQYWLSRVTGMSAAQLCHLAAGRSRPAWVTLNRIAAALGIDLAALLTKGGS